MTDLISTPALRVLHLDDDVYDLQLFANALKQSESTYKFQLESVKTPEEFYAKLKKAPAPDLVVLDIHIKNNEEKTGVELAKETKKLLPHCVVIMRSIADDIETLMTCLRSGADDFLSKRTDKGELGHRLYNAYNLASLKLGSSKTKSSPSARSLQQKFAGQTLQVICDRLPNIIASAISCIHITGESGTGKEVVADILGEILPSGVPFVKINCGAIAANVLEAELFGHKKGAFTGAVADRRGLFEAANHGWIFLDEVATLSPSAQTALLRVIENKELYRVGSTTPVSLDIRILSATNENLEEAVKAGKFRQDLWQRLCEVRLFLPPLRQRNFEIEPLIKHFCASMSGGPYEITQTAVEILCSASWRQGNIRELRNCLRAMTEFSMDKLLTPLAIPAAIWDEVGEGRSGSRDDFALASVNVDRLELKGREDSPLNFDYLSKQLLLKLVQIAAAADGKLSLRGLSAQLAIPRSTLTDRLKELVVEGFIDARTLGKMVNIKRD